MQTHTIFFFTTVLMFGFFNGLQNSFVLYLMKELGAPTVLLGGTIFVAGASNFVLFSFTSKIIAFFGGILPSLAFAMVFYFAKMLIFGLSKSPYIVFASQVFNGFNFAIFLAAGVQHTRHISADETITSMYGIFNGLHFGAGVMLANFVGGACIQRFGTSAFFIGAAIVAGTWTVIIFLYHIFQEKNILGNQKESTNSSVVNKDQTTGQIEHELSYSNPAFEIRIHE